MPKHVYHDLERKCRKGAITNEKGGGDYIKVRNTTYEWRDKERTHCLEEFSGTTIDRLRHNPTIKKIVFKKKTECT